MTGNGGQAGDQIMLGLEKVMEKNIALVRMLI
jgi:hypothetical protein